MQTRKPCRTDISDDERGLLAPQLTFVIEETSQREHSLLEVFKALSWTIRAGAPRQMMPDNLPSWHTVYHQNQRWIKVGCFETMASSS